MATAGESSGLLLGAPAASPWAGAPRRVRSPTKCRPAGQCAGNPSSPIWLGLGELSLTARLSPPAAACPCPPFHAQICRVAAQQGPPSPRGPGCAAGRHVRQQSLGGLEGGGAAAHPAGPGQSSGLGPAARAEAVLFGEDCRHPAPFSLHAARRPSLTLEEAPRCGACDPRSCFSLRRLEEVCLPLCLENPSGAQAWAALHSRNSPARARGRHRRPGPPSGPVCSRHGGKLEASPP